MNENEGAQNGCMLWDQRDQKNPAPKNINEGKTHQRTGSQSKWSEPLQHDVTVATWSGQRQAVMGRFEPKRARKRQSRKKVTPEQGYVDARHGGTTVKWLNRIANSNNCV